MKALFALAFALSAAALVLAFAGPILSIAPPHSASPTALAVAAPEAPSPPLPSPPAPSAHVVDLAPIVIVGRRAKPSVAAAPTASTTIEFEANEDELWCSPSWRPLEIGAGTVRDCVVRPPHFVAK